MRKIVVMFLCAAFFCAASTGAERRGVVVCFRSGSQALFDDNKAHVLATLDILRGAGVSNIVCHVEGGAGTVPGALSASSSSVMDSLRKIAGEARLDDELWLFFYGHANSTGRGLSFAAEGGRIGGKELAGLVGGIPGRKFVFCMNTQAFSMLELLRGSDAVVLSATSSAGQLNPPLLPRYFLPEWGAGLDKPVGDVLREACDELREYFLKNSMAIEESAVILSGGELFKSPFNVAFRPLKPFGKSLASGPSRASPPEKSSPKAGSPGQGASKADAETLRVFDLGRKAAGKYPGFGWVVAGRDVEHVVATGSPFKTRIREWTYIVDESGVEHNMRRVFHEAPPFTEIRSLRCRVVLPDGVCREAVTEKIPLKTGGFVRQVRFDGAEPGSMVEVEMESEHGGGGLRLQDSFELQGGVPIAWQRLRFLSPPGEKMFFKVVNPPGSDGGRRESKTMHSVVNEFVFEDAAPFERLPNDPPMDESLARLLVSSSASWEEFSKWASAMFGGAEKLDDSTVALAARLAEGAATDAEKVRAIYEFLCGLRYETVPSGARAFRPRTPGEVAREKYGDCKDKANALVAMVSSLGVRGSVALVKRGGRTVPDFPSNQFNHAVAYFPKLEGYPDGFWCDPTDTSTPFGSLPPGDCGSDALLLGEGGGFKRIRPNDGRGNVLSQELFFKVSPDGSFEGRSVLRGEGLRDYQLRMAFKNLTPARKKSVAQQLMDSCVRGARVEAVETSRGGLYEPFWVETKFSGGGWEVARDSVSPPFDLAGLFSLKNRDRPLWINDGQPLRTRQVVRVEGASLGGSGSWEKSAGPLLLRCGFDKDGRGRTVEAELSDGLVPPGEYEKCAAAVFEWTSKMKCSK